MRMSFAGGLSGFAWMNATQFLGALNDNVFRFTVVFFLIERLSASASLAIPLVTVLFILPFLIFSPLAGGMADHFSKRSIALAAKSAELAVMLLALPGLWLGWSWWLYGCVFLMCTQSAFFGPVKYGILPELVSRERLSSANGHVVFMTYLAIILGTFLPSFLLVAVMPGGHAGVVLVCAGIALLGLVAVLRVPRVAGAGAPLHVRWLRLAELVGVWREIGGVGRLRRALLGSAYFLFLGGFLQQAILIYGEDALGWTATRSGFLFPMAALGIGLGALVAGRAGGRWRGVTVLAGAVLMGGACVALGVLPALGGVAFGLMLVTGFGAGLFIVPLSTYLQERSPEQRRGSVLAASNFLSFTGVLLSAGVLFVLTGVLGLSAKLGLAVVGVMTVAGAVVGYPGVGGRLVAMGVRCCLRLRCRGLEHVSDGAVVLVANHATLVDPLLLSWVLKRRVLAVGCHEVGSDWRLRLGSGRVDWVSWGEPGLLEACLAHTGAGGAVVVFPEGRATLTGNMRAFDGEVLGVLAHLPVARHPVYIAVAEGRMWRAGRLPVGSWLRWRGRVGLIFGESQGELSAWGWRAALMGLSCEAPRLLGVTGQTLGQAFVRSARRNCWRRAVSDTTGKSLRYGKLLMAGVALTRLVRRECGDERYVGILLPASVGGVIANVAVTLAGKVPVNLNFSLSPEQMLASRQRAGLSVVLTSKRFVDKLGDRLPSMPGMVFLEDWAARIGPRERLAAMVTALVGGSQRFDGRDATEPQDAAAILFSSGSTGEPKGVVLTHGNVLANIWQIQQVFCYGKDDRVCGVLPFFHSFGLTVTLWASLLSGASAVYHPNPLEGGVIGRLIRERRLTLLLGTPSFLSAWLPKLEREDLGSVRALITGAERLPPKLAAHTLRDFGIEPMEGYGVTELSPVVSVNVPDRRWRDDGQPGSLTGSVGQVMPGMAIRLVDLETGEVRENAEEGVLEVYGPNVMAGYLDEPGRTRSVLREGWYRTGDVVKVDAAGFMTIADRLARFSKIGGEMVPHIKIERLIEEALDVEDRCVAVMAVPDERRGEQLVVCVTEAAGDVARIREIVEGSELPNLWKPRHGNYFQIDEIPVLGSGKLDMVRLQKMVDVFMSVRPGRMQRAMDRLKESL